MLDNSSGSDAMGFNIMATSVPSGSCSSRLRTRVVLPVPTSPVSCTKPRSEEHTSELQSRGHLVCRLLLEKKKDIPFKSSPYTDVEHSITNKLSHKLPVASRTTANRL